MFTQAKQFSLEASELNQLVQNDIQTNPNLHVTKKSFALEPYDHTAHEFTYYEVIMKHKEKKFILFPMVKDADDFENQRTLYPIKKVVQQFYQHYQDRDCVLLLPLLQCLGYSTSLLSFWNPQRMHAVLVEIDLNENKKKIEVHDSQGLIKNYSYVDCLTQFATENQFDYVREHDYHAYGKQVFLDRVSCGYFVCTYIGQILRDGHSGNCKNIQIDARELCQNKQEYLNAKKILIWNLNDNNDIEVDSIANVKQDDGTNDEEKLDEGFLVLS